MGEKLLRTGLTFILRLLFGARVRGLEHFAAAGNKVLIIANHQSFLDPLLLAVLIPEKPAFAMNVFQAEKWYFRWVAKVVKIYRLDPSQPMSMKKMLTDLKTGAKIVLFPEGRITTSGGIMKVYDGASMITQKTGATILPVHIEGAQYSLLSRLKGKARRRLFPRISITCYPPVSAENAPNSQAIYDVMTHNAFAAQNRNRSLLAAILEARNIHGRKHSLASDISRTELTYGSLFTRSFILSDKLKPYVSEQQYVGILLPNALAAIVSFVSLHILRKIPCMLNFSAGEKNIFHACKIATVKTILTSRAFIEKGKLEALATALAKEYTVIYLEDIRATITSVDKLKGAAKALTPWLFLNGVARRSKSYDPAVILYTSGSEGVPKGVALSHANILANIYQSSARFDITAADKLFNAMPVFHSFGLTIGMLMPLVRGLFVFLYPSPLHYRVIPELIYDIDATIMVGTDTFYQGYAHYAHAYDFRSIRLAVAGAEKLKDQTRTMFFEKFGVPIMQGYGVTETSPVISCNTGLYHKTGSVGRVFPDIECQLEPIEGIARGGKLWVKGPNVMLGYLKADHPGVIQPQGEYYDTGDIVNIDEEGYITILGRAKRFAKIAGEMVSLAAIEEFTASLSPNFKHAATAIPDDRKGEQVVLVTEDSALTRQQLQMAARNAGIPEIFLPKHVIAVVSIPLLGSGKVDYPSVLEIVKASTL